MSARAPVVGVTLDSEQPGGYSKFPWYALRENYMSALLGAGALPVGLAHEDGAVGAYLDLIDGLVVTGGAFDVDPALFGEAECHQSVTLKSGRTDFELAVTRAALERDMPVLGICGGQQLLNVALGGTLIQHLPDAVDGALAHEQPNPRDEAGHKVRIETGTLLRRIVGTGEMDVNSAHHQAVREPAPGCVVDAVAPDGVIEGIEDANRRFCLGVQWHPEFLIAPGDGLILRAFTDACRS